MAGESHRRKIKEQGSTALTAIRQLQESLEEWDPTDRKIENEQTTLAKELEEYNRVWKSTQSRWRKEEEEWKRQEEKIEQMREALMAHNLQSSPFVEQFLREKNLPNNLGDLEVEIYLRKDIADKEIAQSRQLRLHYQILQTYQRDLQLLDTQSKQWKELVERRVKDHRKIVTTLEQLGLKKEKIEALVIQLEESTRMLKEYTILMENCISAIKEREVHIKECEKELSIFRDSLVRAVGEIDREIGNLRSCIEQVKNEIDQIDKALRVAVLATGGGILGAIVGTVLLPGAGTVIGAALGAVGGGSAGAVMTDSEISQKKEILRELKKELADKQRQLESCNSTARNAQEEVTELEKLNLFG